MTLAELIAEVQALTGRENDTVLITSARIIRWLNEAQIDIARICSGHINLETSDPDAITLVADTFSYSIAALNPSLLHLLKAYYMDGSQSRELSYTDTDTFDTAYPDIASLAGAIPQEYTRRGNTIEVFPKPTSSEAGKYIRLDYTKRPTAFSTGSLSATCELADADQGLIYYAVSEAYKAMGNKQDMALVYRNPQGTGHYDIWLSDYRKNYDGLYGDSCAISF
jgi:hypothetical protein